MKKRRVYIVNKGPHTYEAAARYGRPVALSEGRLSRFAAGHLYRVFKAGLADSRPDDYLLLSGLGLANAIAASVFATMHGRLNLLLYNGGWYVLRSINLTDTESEDKSDGSD